MSVYFCNAEPIDLNAISIMGVSVKTRANPIGFFGTGLKFSIATLLRLGHQVSLYRNAEPITFTVDREVIRGEDFDVVKMGGQRLGFTTKLGRTWEVWQAYRELYCNCLDEGGQIATELPEGDWGTIFEVSGEAIEHCHRNRREIFLQSTSAYTDGRCEIHTGQNQSAFYHGVKAHKHATMAMLTYNVTAQMDLTEDRTLKHSFMLDFHVEQALAACTDEGIIETALLAPKGSYENGLSFENASDKPSDVFMNVAFRLRYDRNCNRAALRLWERHADHRLAYTEATLDDFEQELLGKAVALVARLGVTIDRRDFIVIEGLGDGVFGSVRNGQILIAHATFDMGHRFLASTLYEEWLHKSQNMRDESRGLQNLLFEKLFAMVERVVAMETRPS